MSFAAPILQVGDLVVAENFFHVLFGFTRVRMISNKMIELHGNIGVPSLFLVEVSAFPNQVLGGSVVVPTSSLITLAALAQRHHISATWICNGNALLLQGPSNIVIISFNSESVGCSGQKISFMDVMAEYSGFLEPSLGEEQDLSPLPAVAPPTPLTPEKSAPPQLSLSFPLTPRRTDPPPPLIDNFILQIASRSATISTLPSSGAGNSPMSLKPFHPNARQAVPFENDVFLGKILFVVRTKPLDPVYKHFFEHHKDRMYLVQLQGVFKKPPERSSSLYMGVETMSPVSMGMMTKGVCRAMLKLGNAKLKGKNTIRHSFGRGTGDTAPRSLSEDASHHLGDAAFASVPLLIAADRLCVTPAGSLPPDICQEFRETAGSNSRRRNNPDSIQFDDTSTYSFTFKGRNIDFCEWATCGFYMMKPVPLSKFLGASDGLRLVAYCLPGRGKAFTPPAVSGMLNNCESLEDMAAKTSSGVVYFMEANVVASTSQIMVSHDERVGGDVNDDDDENRDDDVDDDDIENYESEGSVTSDAEEERAVFSATKDATDDFFHLSSDEDPERKDTTPGEILLLSGHDCKPSSGIKQPPPPLISASMSLPHIGRQADMNWTHSDMQYCMGALEIDDYRLGRRRRVAYMVTVPGYPTRLRSYMQLAAAVPLLKFPADGSETRLTESEKRRRQIARSLQHLELDSRTSEEAKRGLNNIFDQPNVLDEYFLKKAAPSPMAKSVCPEDLTAIQNQRSLFNPADPGSALDNFSSASAQPIGGSILSALRPSIGSSNTITYDNRSHAYDIKAVRMEGAVCVCTGRRSWSEEWAVLNGQYFEIYMPQMPRHLRLPSRIMISQIKSVSMLTKDLKPFGGGYEFFSIGTAARVYYFCVKSQRMLDQWLDALLMFQRPPEMVLGAGDKGERDSISMLSAAYPSLGEDLPLDSEDPEACIVHSGSFLSSLPGVLNMRKVLFFATFAGRETSVLNESPVLLSQELLRKILLICNPSGGSLNSSFDSGSDPSSYEWIEFSDRVCQLQTLSLAGLRRDELVAFFLNVYHLLLTHAFIVHGVPGRPLEWRSFKKKAVYEIAGDVMSLRDIDEIILGNSCNQFVFLNILRRNIPYADAIKQYEASRNAWLNSEVIFPTGCMHMGRAVGAKSIGALFANQKEPRSALAKEGESHVEHIDWRVALCVCSGSSVHGASNEIVVYDGDTLSVQLDGRCRALLFSQVRTDLSSPTFLNSTTPSIIMPLALSTLLLVTNSRTMRLVPSPVLKTTSPDDPLFWISSVEYFLNFALTSMTKSSHAVDFLASSRITDQRAVLSIAAKLTNLKKAKQECEAGKMHVFFNSPTYTSFRFLRLTTDACPGPDRGTGESGDLSSFTSSWSSHCQRNNARGRYKPVTTLERVELRNQQMPRGALLPQQETNCDDSLVAELAETPQRRTASVDDVIVSVHQSTGEEIVFQGETLRRSSLSAIPREGEDNSKGVKKKRGSFLKIFSGNRSKDKGKDSVANL